VSLGRGDLRQLRQRITVRWKLRPFERDEVREYLEHRLRIAGLRQANLFTPGAARALYRASRGIPRIVNAVADRALLAAYSTGQRRVDARTVRRAATELPASQRNGWVRSRRWIALGLLAVAIGGLVAGGLALADRDALSRLAARTLRPVGAGPPYRQDRSELISGLAAMSRSSSAASALHALLGRWGYAASLPEEIEPNLLPSMVREVSSLRVFAARFTRERLAGLNVPAILELELEGGELRYLALLRLDEANARVALGEREFELAAGTLASRWNGRAFLLWRNFESLPALAPGMTGSAVRWLQVRLSELGYLREGDASAEYDALTVAAIRRFQSAHALEITGDVGPATMIALYHNLDYESPSLAADGESS
jgi:general secretion pathway protein A